MVSRIKLLSGCNLAEKRRPQDGRIKREQGGREIELRVSTMPTAFGEKAVLRIFDPDILLKGVDQLGFATGGSRRFRRFPLAHARHHSGHRPDRQRQDHDALLGPEAALQARGEHRHDRGPDRDGARGLQPGGGASRDRRDVRERAAHRAAAGSRHHHGRRDPRHRNRARTPSRPRSPGTSCCRRCTRTTRRRRSRGCSTSGCPHFLVLLDGDRDPGAAARPGELSALRCELHPDD